MENKDKQVKETTTFELDAIETARAKKFCAEHKKHVKHMSAGECFEFIFMPTMIGDVCSVHCLSCGAVENITNWDKM